MCFVFYVQVSGKKKPVGSTAGMQTSVNTSQLLDFRAKNTVPKRLEQMTEAIQNRDLQTFAELTMKVSIESVRG